MAVALPLDIFEGLNLRTRTWRAQQPGASSLEPLMHSINEIRAALLSDINITLCCRDNAMS